MHLAIKGMVCRRCVDTVIRTAEALDLPFSSVQIGQITCHQTLSQDQVETFRKALQGHGFDLLETRRSQLIESIKRLLRQRARAEEENTELKLSTFLSSQLNYEYSHLSKLFSEQEGITIERYFTQQRLERAKELLAYGELSVTEIAESLHYSNPAHLSSHFKRETGMTPSAFRKLKLSQT